MGETANKSISLSMFLPSMFNYMTNNVILQTKFADVICINRYYGWYFNMGHLNLIQYELSYDLEQWHNTEKKPMIISEYGASTIAGFHEVCKQPNKVITLCVLQC